MKKLKENFKIFLKTNKNGKEPYQNLWNSGKKTVLIRIFSFFGSTQYLTLVRQVFYHWPLAPCFVFALVIFKIESRIYSQGWPQTVILLSSSAVIYASHKAGIIGVYQQHSLKEFYSSKHSHHKNRNISHK
jgi:amino acid transporter